MTRPAGWEAGLNAWAATLPGRRFDWADFNCGFMAADAAIAMGLPDPAAAFRDWPVRRLKRLSHARLMAAVPFPEIPVASARRGDWLAYDTESGPALAVCFGATARGFAGDQLCVLPTLAASRAFRVE